MKTNIRQILDALADYERNDPSSRGMELRLNLAEIILRGLNEKGWSQGDLALKANLKDSYVSRVIHSNANCTFETAGKLLFALGVNARIEEQLPQAASTEPLVAQSDEFLVYKEQRYSHGKKNTEKTEPTVYAGEEKIAVQQEGTGT